MNKKQITILGLCLLIVCSSYAKRKKDIDTTSVVQISYADSLVKFASKFVGTPYRSTRYSNRAFDCSGFTSFVFDNFGYKLGASSGTQIFNGAKIGRNELSKGDLVFFKGRNSSSDRIGHVGIIVDVDSASNNFRFIHSSTSRGVIIEEFPTHYYSNRYIGACRVLSTTPAPISFDDVSIELPQINDTVTRTTQETEKLPMLSHTSPNTVDPPISCIVKKGDTLYSISKKYGLTVAKLMSLNNMSNSNLSIGKKLKIK